MTNSLTIKRAGAASLLIDRGRQGAQANGLSESGPMDEHAYLWGNQLVGNSLSMATIEIALGGLSLSFNNSCIIAITGADMQPTLNGQTACQWQSLNIHAGDTLSFGFSSYGNYAYLSIQGGFSANSLGDKHAEIFQSKSCVMREQLGGHNHGQPLTNGEKLFFKSIAQPTTAQTHHTPRRFQRHYNDDVCALRVLPSYQFTQFTANAQHTFFEQTYLSSALSDRMGYQLQGKAIDVPASIISEGIALGSIQISNSGQPIVLMRDRQTIGGYPKIGTVYSCDIEKLAQLKPRSSIQFIKGNIEEAYNLRLQRERFFNAAK